MASRENINKIIQKEELKQYMTLGKNRKANIKLGYFLVVVSSSTSTKRL